MRMAKALRANRDLPQLEGINLNAQAGSGSGADYEHAFAWVPNLRQGAPTQTAGITADNAMTTRWFGIIFEANLTGTNTNYVTYNVLQRRGGNFLVNTTSATTLVVGSNVITPASMTNIFVNTQLTISGGTGGSEVVTVQSVNLAAGTFTATCVGTHSGAYTIVSAPLATITYTSGTNATAWVPVQLASIPGTYLKAGDVLTLQRFSVGTGLATPALTVFVDWENVYPR